MAFEEYIRKAISTGIGYDKLPDRVRATLSLADYKSRVREYCILKGLSWESSMARDVCTEQDYYDELIRAYKAWARLYPYHLAGYVARVMRSTPFKYYCDVLFMMLKDEKSYDRIPNFTAADALRVTGVGRNEYISIMNACKAKKLLWRVNKGIARDLLPAAPMNIKMEGWWMVHVVNVGDAEFRELSPAEANLLRQACEAHERQQQHMSVTGTIGSGSSLGPAVSNFDVGLLQQLYKRGIIYLEVPVSSTDKLSVPPLEGFVSNKTSELGDESVDPFEPLLYNLFIANSSRLDQARLADILGVDLQQLLLATSIALRLGFATKLTVGSSISVDELGAPLRGLTPGAQGGSQAITIPDSNTESFTPRAGAGAPSNTAATGSDSTVWQGAAGAAGGDGDGDGAAGAVGVVVDAEATSYLMMGALSPGLKRHSVTLFEGGRVGGAAVIDELVNELAASAAAGAHFEGDMVQLMCYIKSLGILLSVVRSAAAAQGQQLELLRKESLEGLDSTRAAKVLSHAYTAILQVAPMPGPPLPINPLSAGSPVLFGPTAAADSGWMQLALYSAARCGPSSLVIPAGHRVWRLPGCLLQGVSHAVLWGWTGPPLLVEGANLLCSLNDLLCRTAVLVQPLVYNNQVPAEAVDAGQLVSFVDVPLPLCPLPSLEARQQLVAKSSDATSWDPFHGPSQPAQETMDGLADQPATVTRPSTFVATAEVTAQQQQKQTGEACGSNNVVLAIDRQSGKVQQFIVPDHLTAALDQLQLRSAVGWLRVVRLPKSSSRGVRSSSSQWLPLTLSLGVPLFCPLLCQQICNNMADRRCLTPAGQADWRTAQLHLQQHLWQLIAQYGVLGASYNCINQGRQNPGSAADSELLPASGGATAAADVGVGLELPARSLLFDGMNLLAVDLSDCLQGVSMW